jgi:hypothetical protein
MTQDRQIVLMALALLLCGCASPPPRNPTDNADVLRRLQRIPLQEFRHSQSSGLVALRELVALAKHADRPVIININDVEGVVALSTERWIAERKRVLPPEVLTMGYTGWAPPTPRFGEWTVTVILKDTNVREAFAILCEVSGLEWSVDKWMGIRVRFANEEANKLLQATPEPAPNGAASRAPEE